MTGTRWAGSNLAAMPEQSHLDEMREKIRGDRERRAAKRGVAAIAASPSLPAPREPVATPAEPERAGLFERARRAFRL